MKKLYQPSVKKLTVTYQVRRENIILTYAMEKDKRIDNNTGIKEKKEWIKIESNTILKKYRYWTLG